MFSRVTLSNEITDSASAGTSYTAYGNQAVQYVGALAPAATKRLVFLSAVNEVRPNMGAEFLARYRAPSAGASNVTTSEGIPGPLSNVAYNAPLTKTITPTMHYIQKAVGDLAQIKNIDDIDAESAEDASNDYADMIDQLIATDLAGATLMTNTVRGAGLIFAGESGRAIGNYDSAITAADVFSLSLLNEAKTRLEEKEAFYYNSGVLTKSALVKNTWHSDPEDPFVLVIGPNQVKAFLNDAQFISYKEYGDSTILLNGEIGMDKVFGIRIVVSDNIPSKSAGEAAWDGTTAAVDLNRCFLMKGMRAYTFVSRIDPYFKKIETGDFVGHYLRVQGVCGGAVVNADAIVMMDVATNQTLA